MPKHTVEQKEKLQILWHGSKRDQLKLMLQNEDELIFTESLKVFEESDGDIFIELINNLPESLIGDAIEKYSNPKNCKIYGVLLLLDGKVSASEFEQLLSLITLDSLKIHIENFGCFPSYNLKFLDRLVQHLISIDYVDWKTNWEIFKPHPELVFKFLLSDPNTCNSDEDFSVGFHIFYSAIEVAQKNKSIQDKFMFEVALVSLFLKFGNSNGNLFKNIKAMFGNFKIR